MAGEFPALESLFGEENVEPCLDLIKAFFSKPPLYGPQAVFLVYEPGELENPFDLCRSLESEIRPSLPPGSKCSFKAAMKGDPGFAEVAPNVLWFDLSTGEAFPPEERKLGFKNKSAVAPPKPRIATPGGGSVALRGAPPPPPPVPDAPPFAMPGGEAPGKNKKKKKNIDWAGIAKAAAGFILAGVAIWFALSFFGGDEKKTQKKKKPRRTETQEAAKAPEPPKPVAEEKPAEKPPEVKPQEEPEQEDESAANGPVQDPFKGKRVGPRNLSALTDALGSMPFFWYEDCPAETRPDCQPSGAVWWCVFASDRDDKNAETQIYRIVSRGDSKPPVVGAYDDRGHLGETPVEWKDFERRRRSEPHIELFETTGCVYTPPRKNPRKPYPPPHPGEVFSPARIELGEGLMRILRSAGTGSRAKTEKLLWNIEFTYCDPKPIQFVASFDRDLIYGDIQHAVRLVREGLIADLEFKQPGVPGEAVVKDDGKKPPKALGESGMRESGLAGPSGRHSSGRHGSGKGLGGGARGGFGGARSGFRGSPSGSGFGKTIKHKPQQRQTARNTAPGKGEAKEKPKEKSPMEIAKENASRPAIERDILAGQLVFSHRDK